MSQLLEPALILFALGAASLSWRYERSDAFQNPIHLSVITLLLAGVAFLVWALSRRKKGNARYEPLPLPADDEAFEDDKAAADRANKGFSVPMQVVFGIGIAIRVDLLWRITESIHCSWGQVQVFLPFLVGLFDTILPLHRSSLPNMTYRARAKFLLAAFFWAVTASKLILSTERPTGVICPADPWEQLVPLAQFLSLIIDSAILSYVGGVVRGRGLDSATLSKLGRICLAAAVAIIAIDWLRYAVIIRWDFNFHHIAKRDLGLDSILATLTMLTGIKALASLTPSAVATLATCVTLFTYVETRVFDWTLAAALATWPVRIASLCCVLGAAATVQYSSANHRVPGESVWRSFRPWIVSALVAAVIISQVLVFQRSGPRDVPALLTVMAKARADSQKWFAGVKVSTNLREAVDEYKRRYGIPPPPGFDKWYEYAVQNESPIIDEFAQIHEAFMPFWGVPADVLRERTVHMLETDISIAGVAIENGTAKPMVDHWLVNNVAEMIQPFAQWLPDMQMAFNLDDECRVSVPYERMQEYQKEGGLSRQRLAGKGGAALQHDFSTSRAQTWRPVTPQHQWSPYFEKWYSVPILHDWISTACPPDSYARNYHWWNTKSACVSCYAPHTVDGFMANWSLAGDLCHQPDLVNLHGTLMVPLASRPTHELFPVFAQSRFHNFHDIVYPNPWNFASAIQFSTEHAVPWETKHNAVFWRGGHSEGNSFKGQWRNKLRTRFVDMANRVREELSRVNIEINATFVGKFGNCGEGDCESMNKHFYGASDATPPPGVPFEEAWKNRHLMDMDGAAFSGRFPSFVQSASLPYRAAIWRAWWEDRIHAFVHFVPVDVRLTTDLWRLVEYFGSINTNDGKKIADEGAEWASRSMRREDMRVYLFRQLLEWGRITDDRREEIGFSM